MPDLSRVALPFAFQVPYVKAKNARSFYGSEARHFANICTRLRSRCCVFEVLAKDSLFFFSPPSSRRRRVREGGGGRCPLSNARIRISEAGSRQAVDLLLRNIYFASPLGTMWPWITIHLHKLQPSRS